MASTAGWAGVDRGEARRWRRVAATGLAVVLGAAGVLTPTVARAAVATYVVTSAADTTDGSCDSHCTLREALAAANANPGADTITFALPGSAPFTIQPTSALVAFGPVVIDATTQPGWIDDPIVFLDGTGQSGGDGLQLQTSGATVRGLAIGNFDGFGIWLRGSSNTVESSWIGIDPAGSPAGNGSSGVAISGSSNTVGGTDVGNVIGASGGLGVGVGGSTNSVVGNIIGLGPSGTAAASPTSYSNLNGIEVNGSSSDAIGNVIRDNVVTGNRQEGIQIVGARASGTIVAGNLVGVNSTATAAIGNGPNFRGINLAFGTHGNTIGGVLAADANVIGGNRVGIQLISDTTIGNTIVGNLIGTNATGADLRNSYGILAYSGPNTIGGTSTGAGNTIRFNNFYGVQVASAGTPPRGVRISGNSIDRSGLIGIDLAGVDANDPLDADGGPNDGQNFPVVTSAVASPTAITIGGTLDTTANASFRVEFFASPACATSGRGEGRRFLGGDDVTTDGSGRGTFSTPLAVVVTAGEVVTATAIDASGSTSEFSACFTPTVSDGTSTFTVNSSADTDDGACTSGNCTLREAINASNATPQTDRIVFSGVTTIAPTSVLPALIQPVHLDGGTAPDCAGAPGVVLDGSAAGVGANGLEVAGGTSIVRGLAVGNWAAAGILVTSAGNAIECNHVGTNAAGTAAAPNNFGIEVRNAANNLVGGTATGRGNLLSGNTFQGVRITGAPATGNAVQGNRIGTDVTGMSAIANGAFGGVNLGGSNNTVGGTDPGARNLISGNGGQGIFMPTPSSGHTIVGNWIGVDATGNGPLPNGADGVFANGATSGGSTGHEIRGNVISANRNSGVQLSGAFATGTVIEDNLIGLGADGTTVLGNHPIGAPTAGWGVIVGGSDTVIRRNSIVGNGAGVSVGTSTAAGITGVSITENSIDGNGALGIDLANDGVTLGDAGDSDTGPNGLQNFPVLSAADADSVEGTLESTPSTTFRVETFSSPACDSSGFGEGRTFLGAADVTTTGAGTTTFSVATTGVVDGAAITATATAPDGSTSEFSPCVEAQTAGHGRVRIVKQTVPAGGTGFVFTGPAGATPTADSELTPGGPVVVFVTDAGGVSHIEVLDVTSGAVTPIAGSSNAANPTLSPDGTRLAYSLAGDLKVRDNATGTVATIPDGGVNSTFRSLTWSPDGSWLAYDHADDIWAVRADGSGVPVQLTTDPAADTNPAWGPDGRIAFRSSRSAQRVWVGTFDSSSASLTGLVGLTNSSAIPSQQREMDWSPDGASLVVAAAVNSASTDDLYLIAADGSGGVTQLTTDAANDTAPTWSPDGARIGYSSNGIGGAALSFLPAGGGAPAVLYDGAGAERTPDWGTSAWFGSSSYQLDDGDTIGGLVADGDTVTFTEATDDDWYISGIDCGGAPGAAIDIDAGSVSLTVSAGDDIVCTVTNTALATLTVASQTRPAGDPTAFEFSGAVAGSIADGQTLVAKVRPGTHVVTQGTTSEFWRLSTVFCDDADSRGNRTDRTATFVADPGEAVICTFTNQGYGRVTIAKTTDPGGAGGFPFTGPARATPEADRVLLGADIAVFARASNGLFVLDLRSGEVAAIPGTAGGQDPELSPDNERVAYSVSNTLRVVELGSGQTSVVATGVFTRAASWSPDGSWLVFHASDDLWVVPSDGSALPTQLTTGAPAESFPAWAADGRIAWRANKTGGNIRVATFDPSTMTLVGEVGLANSIGFPSQHRAMHWSPDGALLAAGGAVNAAADTNLHVLAGDGSGSYATIVDDIGYDTEPTFTADGTHILYRGSDVATADLRVVPADGSAKPSTVLGGSTQDLAPDLGAGWTAQYTLADGDSIGGLVPAGDTIRFSEGDVDHWWLRDIDCQGAANATADVDAGSVDVSPAVGEELTCTFQNEQFATIAVEKVVEADSRQREFPFSGDLAGTIAAGGRLEAEVKAGTQTVTEDRSGLPYWIEPGITCDDTEGAASSGAGDTATFRTSPGEEVVCVFHNIPIPMLTVTKLQANVSVFSGFTSAPISVQPGDRVAYRVEVTNIGDGRADSVALGDDVPDPTRTSLVSAPTGPTCDAALTCAIGSLLPGETATLTYVVVVDLGCDVHGTRFDDNGGGSAVIVGTGAAETICGFGGGDVIRGNGGDDDIWGNFPANVALTDFGGTATVTWTGAAGAGTDSASSVAHIVAGVDGADDVLGGGGDDVIHGQDGGDTLRGEAGHDIVYGGTGPDTIEGAAGDDLLFGGDDGDSIEGDAGNDTISGQAGIDRLGGGSGNDTMYGGDDRDFMDGDAGNDSMFGQDGNDIMDGGTGVDEVRGGDGDDVLRGGTGGDELAGGPGNDTLLGEGNDDWLHGDQGSDIVRGGSGNDLVSGDDGNDFVYGEDGNDNVSGDGGDDFVFGDDGDDRVTGGSGHDHLYGGDGNDRAGRTVRASHPLRDGDRSNVAAGVYGEDGNDTLYGNSGDDTLFGGEHDDRLQGGPGKDWLQGQAGDDVLWGDDAGQGIDGGDGQPDGLEGNEGDDSLYGQRGNNITTQRVADGHRAGLFGGSGSDWINGGPLSDDIFGGPGSDALKGNDGKDRLAGDASGPGEPSADDSSGSPDQINGGDGIDLIYGQGGGDTTSASFSPGSRIDDNRPGMVSAQLQGGPGSGGDVVHGGPGDDRVDGGAGNKNVLIGAAGGGDFCSFGGSASAPDIRDTTCEQPSSGTANVNPRVWDWDRFR